MTDLTKLADALKAVRHIADYGRPGTRDVEQAALRAAIDDAEALLRSAAGVDVAGLMAKIRRLCDLYDEVSVDHFMKEVAALESALRLALAARDDDVFTALDMSPDTFRTEGGAVNVGKLRAAIRHPADYLPPDHWLAAAAPKGTT